jgi:outer membrane cobalamin receptor
MRICRFQQSPAIDHRLINLGVSVPAGPVLDLDGRVQNAFDRAYEEIVGLAALRRTAILGVRVGTAR